MQIKCQLRAEWPAQTAGKLWALRVLSFGQYFFQIFSILLFTKEEIKLELARSRSCRVGARATQSLAQWSKLKALKKRHRESAKARQRPASGHFGLGDPTSKLPSGWTRERQSSAAHCCALGPAQTRQMRPTLAAHKHDYLAAALLLLLQQAGVLMQCLAGAMLRARLSRLAKVATRRQRRSVGQR